MRTHPAYEYVGMQSRLRQYVLLNVGGRAVRVSPIARFPTLLPSPRVLRLAAC